MRLMEVGMDIVRIRCGFGNQIFCYAFYLELKQRGRDVGLDLGFYEDNPNWPDPYMMEYVFPDIGIEPIDSDIFRGICKKYNEEKKDIQRLSYLKSHPKERYFWGEEKNEVGIFDQNVFETENCVFVGSWISEKYFANAKSQLRDKMKFRRGEKKLYDLEKKMREEESVTLQIRLGSKYSYLDVQGKNGEKMLNIIRDGYYRRAIDYMKQVVGDNAVWYVFSDAECVINPKSSIKVEESMSKYTRAGYEDALHSTSRSKDLYIDAVERIKRELNITNIVYIGKSLFDNYEDWYDMYLMSKARHNIIANSTFGWWGAWLNSNPEKVVISPKRFFSYSECTDINPETWISL